MNLEKLRGDFPVLRRKINGKPIVYFDNACVSLRPKQVVEAMDEYYYKYSSCAGRAVHRLSKEATEKFDESRETIAKFINAKPKEIIFTRNTTEGINLLSHSLNLEKGDIVLSTDKEHNSNLIPWLKTQAKREIVYSNDDGTFNMERFREAMSKKVKLVSFVHTSNLDGYTIPAKEIVRIAHDYGALALLDGAQSVPHMKTDVKKLDADFLVFSGHKMLGPSGFGVLYGKYHLLEQLKPFMVGGDTVQNTTYDSFTLLPPPEKFEAGLQDYAGASGMAAAVEYLKRAGLDDIEKHENELNNIIDKIRDIEGISIIGPEASLRSGITSFNVRGMNYHDVALMLDETANVMVRSGQHCLHSWFNAHKLEGSVRASLYLYNTKEECKTFIETLQKIVKLR